MEEKKVETIEENVEETTKGKGKKKRGKKEKKKKEKGEKKKLSKKQLILIIIAAFVVATGSFAGAYLLNRKKGPVLYLENVDNIPAITEVVGKRKEVKEDKKEEKEKEEENDKSEDTEIDLDTITETHTYSNVENGAEDIGSYIVYLMENYHFVALEDYDVANPEGMVHLAADSQTDGEVIKMEIDYKADTYTIALIKEEGSVQAIQQAKEEEAKRLAEEKEQEKYITRKAAESRLRNCSPQKLGIEGDINNYSVIFDVGRSIIDGHEYYGLNVYEKKEAGAMYIKGIFYVACTGDSIYKYNVEQDTYEKVEG